MFEREYLMAQIIRFGGNISRTAAFIGMERSALHRKLKSLGVSSARPTDLQRLMQNGTRTRRPAASPMSTAATCRTREARVHIEDRGFQFADGVYEVWAVFGGQLLDEEPDISTAWSAAWANCASPCRWAARR